VAFIGGRDRRDHTDGRLPDRRQFVDERHIRAQRVELDQAADQLGSEEPGVGERGRREALVHHDHAVAGRLLDDLADPQQLLFELSAERFDRLLALEVGEHPVWDEQPRPGGGDREPERRQVMELAEHPREGGLATLVGPGDHEDPLRICEREAVSDHSTAVG
jgi:hypothetical protein